MTKIKLETVGEIHRTMPRSWYKLKRVSRAQYHLDSIREFPHELARIIITYASEPKMIYIDSDGNCPMCDPIDDGPEWPCEWHDELQPKPDYRHIRVRDLQIKIICMSND